MREADFDEFSELLKAAFDILGKTPAAKVISSTTLALWFQALAEYPLPAVRAALGAHIRRGKFTPTPADIIEHLEAAGQQDNRLGPEESWALALTSVDQSDTVVWTTECAEAFRIAAPVLSSSGPISARKTFLEAYDRLVSIARAAHEPAEWVTTIGWDMRKRKLALARAVKAGFLPAPAAMALLPAPEVEKEPLTDKERTQLRSVLALLAAGDAARQIKLERAEQERLGDEMAKDIEIQAEVDQYQASADSIQVARMESRRRAAR